MSLKSKIEAVIYASEEPVTLAQLVVLLSEEAQSELDALAARQAQLPLGSVQHSDSDSAASLVVSDEASSPESLGRDEAPGSAVEVAPEAANSQDSAQQEVGVAVEPYSQSGETTEQPAVDSDTPKVEAPSALVPDEPAGGITAEGGQPSPEIDKRQTRERERAVRDYLRGIVDSLTREYAESDRGIEIREVAGGFRFGTKPEYHDAVRGFVKSLKPALKLSLQALETLAVVAYKQPVTAAEISEIRGVDSAGVLGGLLTRKLIQTAGRKQVIGRPMLYKTTREFLVRFGLRDIQELPSMEEFERMAGELAEQEDLPMEATESVIERANARGDAEHIRETNEAASADEASSPAEEAGHSAPSTDAGASLSNDEADATAVGGNGASSSPRAEAGPTGAEQDPK